MLTNIKGKPRYSLLVLPKDREQEIWTGIRAGVEGAKSVYQADEAQVIEKPQQADVYPWRLGGHSD